MEKAYKAMTIRADGKYECRGFIYEIGKTYTHDGDLELCGKGFHCCPNPSDVYNYYEFGDNTEVMEVSIPKIAKVLKSDDKWCVSKIKIEGPVEDKSFNVGKDNLGHSNTGGWNTGYSNTGDRNTGYRNTGGWNTGGWNTGDSNTGDWNTGGWNTGDSNTGDRNTGYSNTGDRNTGYSNTGDRNTGYSNTGDSNTGDRNTGYSNTGYSNTGDRNTGGWNKASFQTGFFNTVEQPVSLFNGKATLSRQEFLDHPGYRALLSVPLKLTKWVENSDLPYYQKVGEYTEGKTVPVEWFDAHKEWWANMNKANRDLVQTLPGFCPDIFKEITGIDVKETIND